MMMMMEAREREIVEYSTEKEESTSPVRLMKAFKTLPANWKFKLQKKKYTHPHMFGIWGSSSILFSSTFFFLQISWVRTSTHLERRVWTYRQNQHTFHARERERDVSRRRVCCMRSEIHDLWSLASIYTRVQTLCARYFRVHRWLFTCWTSSKRPLAAFVRKRSETSIHRAFAISSTRSGGSPLRLSRSVFINLNHHRLDRACPKSEQKFE